MFFQNVTHILACKIVISTSVGMRRASSALGIHPRTLTSLTKNVFFAANVAAANHPPLLQNSRLRRLYSLAKLAAADLFAKIANFLRRFSRRLETEHQELFGKIGKKSPLSPNLPTELISPLST